VICCDLALILQAEPAVAVCLATRKIRVEDVCRAVVVAFLYYRYREVEKISKNVKNIFA
jgi:hypothetical protein